MKLKSLLVSVILIGFLNSCKNDVQKNQEEPKKSKNFKVVLDLLIQKDDSIQLFYQDELIPKFDEKNSLWAVVKGSQANQEISFELPEEIIPTNLRIDISKKQDQNPIKINNFKMKYLEKSFETKDSTMVYYFSANNHLKFDPGTKILSSVNVVGEAYDPYIYTTDKLKLKVKELLK